MAPSLVKQSHNRINLRPRKESIPLKEELSPSWLAVTMDTRSSDDSANNDNHEYLGKTRQAPHRKFPIYVSRPKLPNPANGSDKEDGSIDSLSRHGIAPGCW